MRNIVQKAFLVTFVLLLAGCGTFGLKNIEDSESAQEFAKRGFAKFDYKLSMAKMTLPQSEVKSLGPVHLYSTENELLSVEQKAWSFIQRVNRADGMNCYSYARISRASKGSFSFTPGKLYCYQDEESFQSSAL